MKTTKFVLAAIFTLQLGILFAGNDNITTPATEVTSSINMVSLAPTSPVEATFEEIVVENTFFGLSPITPVEADFEDLSIEMVSVNDLSPVMPSVADFSDTVEISIDQLSPVTPVIADFESFSRYIPRILLLIEIENWKPPERVVFCYPLPEDVILSPDIRYLRNHIIKHLYV